MVGGQIHCWTLGAYRQSVLNRLGHMFRSPNVKKEAIRILTLSPHFGLLTWRSIGGRSGLVFKGFHSWHTYRHTEAIMWNDQLQTLVWAANMILPKLGASREHRAMSQSISLRTVFLTLSGLKVGDEFAIHDLFQNCPAQEVRRLYFLKRLTGDDWLKLQLLCDRLATLQQMSVNSAYEAAMLSLSKSRPNSSRISS